MGSSLFVLFSYILLRFMKIYREQADKIDIKKSMLCMKR